MKHLEYNLQCSCVRYFDLQYPKISKLLFAVPNDRKQSVIQGARYKASGLRSGVSDLILLIPKGKYHALCIELKSEKGKLSDNQKEWLILAEMQGNYCIVCYSFDEFVLQINSYLNQV